MESPDRAVPQAWSLWAKLTRPALLKCPVLGMSVVLVISSPYDAAARPLPGSQSFVSAAPTQRQLRMLRSYERYLARARAQTVRAARAVKFAYRQVGKPYQWGGAGPRTYDCSGLAMAAWHRGGLSLPHRADLQHRMIHRKVGLRHLRPGDLVFFSGDHHVGIYVGHRRFLHAPHTGARVQRGALTGWRVHAFAGAARPGAPAYHSWPHWLRTLARHVADARRHRGKKHAENPAAIADPATTPATPATDHPTTPDAATKAARPAKTDAAAKAAHPAKADGAAKAVRPAKADAVAKAVHAAKADGVAKAAHPAKADAAAKVAHSAKADGAAKPVHPAKADVHTKASHPGKEDGSAKADGAGKADNPAKAGGTTEATSGPAKQGHPAATGPGGWTNATDSGLPDTRPWQRPDHPAAQAARPGHRPDHPATENTEPRHRPGRPVTPDLRPWGRPDRPVTPDTRPSVQHPRRSADATSPVSEQNLGDPQAAGAGIPDNATSTTDEAAAPESLPGTGRWSSPRDASGPRPVGGAGLRPGGAPGLRPGGPTRPRPSTSDADPAADGWQEVPGEHQPPLGRLYLLPAYPDPSGMEDTVSGGAHPAPGARRAPIPDPAVIRPRPAARTDLRPTSDGSARSRPASEGLWRNRPVSDGSGEPGPTSEGSEETRPVSGGAGVTRPVADGATGVRPTPAGHSGSGRPRHVGSGPAVHAHWPPNSVRQESDSDDYNTLIEGHHDPDDEGTNNGGRSDDSALSSLLGPDETLPGLLRGL